MQEEKRPVAIVDCSVPLGGRGRPPVYDEVTRSLLSVFLREFGLTKGIEQAAKPEEEGGMGVRVSIPTAKKIAKEFGVTFKRGRPAPK